MRQLRMFMVCGSIACFGGTIADWIIKGTIKPFTLVLTAFNVAMIIAWYQPEIKELWNKIKGNNDDDFGGGNFGQSLLRGCTEKARRLFLVFWLFAFILE